MDRLVRLEQGIGTKSEICIPQTSVKTQVHRQEPKLQLTEAVTVPEAIGAVKPSVGEPKPKAEEENRRDRQLICHRKDGKCRLTMPNIIESGVAFALSWTGLKRKLFCRVYETGESFISERLSLSLPCRQNLWLSEPIERTIILV